MDDIITSLARKHKLPEEQVELIIRSFYDGLRYYLSNPLESKSGIMIHNLVTFYINQKRVLKEIERVKVKKDYFKESKGLNNNLEFLTQLLENTYKYERQKEK